MLEYFFQPNSTDNTNKRKWCCEVDTLYKQACKVKQAVAEFQKVSCKGQRGERKEKGKNRKTHLVREEERNKMENTSHISVVGCVTWLKRHPY